MKSNKLRKYIFCFALCSLLSASAAPIDQAKRYYRNGQYNKALKELRVLAKRTPRDGTVNYYLGATLLALGQNDEAVAPLEKAVDRGVTDASRLLAVNALEQYRADDAADYLATWEEKLKKNKKDIPEQFNELNRRAISLRNMLERVEKIEVLDTITADKNDFFSAIRLSAGAGSILPPESIRSMGAGTPGAALSTAYLPQSRNRIIWSETDTAGVYELYGADILDNGDIEMIQPLGAHLGQGGDARFPFLMADGITLYFANNGENSLGGYDIFMTRQNEDGEFLSPQNMGMPYNSTANDYLLAIDESSELGWLVSDRNAPEGKVTIYVFSPSHVRRNVEAGDENLLSLARLDDISLTRNPETDYKTLLQERMPAEIKTDTEGNVAILLDLGNGKVYTSLNDFHSNAARAEMIKLLAAQLELDKHIAAEEKMRETYRTKPGESIAGRILESERQTDTMRKKIQTLRNRTVRLETKR